MNNIDWLLSPDKGLPKPDLTLFLTLDLEEISKRKDGVMNVMNYNNFKLKLNNVLEILDTNKDPTIRIVDVGGKTIDQVTTQLWEIIETNKTMN